jgi:hypothetical protein
MLERQLIQEEGFRLLKKALERHSLQRPPFSILIFDEQDISKIADFTLKTFFRHFTLYEFSFKPRRELILRSEPFLTEKMNAQQVDLGEMVPVEGEELERMKHYLNVYQLQQHNDGGLDVEIVENNQASKPAGSFLQFNHTETGNTGPMNSGLNQSNLDNHLL